MSQPHLHDPYTGEPLRHPRTGELLTPIGTRRNGDPIWPALGAAPDDGDGGGDGDNPEGGDGDQDPPGTEDLADAGKKALDAMKAERTAAKREARAAAKRAEEAEAELARLRNAGKPPAADQPDPDQVRRDAVKEATARANARILRAEVRAAAAGRLHDPADALAYLDLTDFDVDDDGSVNSKAITEAIDELIERKSYLAKKTDEAPKPKPPSFDSGARGGGGGGGSTTSQAKAAAMLASRGIPLPATTSSADTTTR